VILEVNQPGENGNPSLPKLFYKRNDFTKKDGLKRELNIESLHSSLQQAWMDAGNASPYPTLDTIIVNRREMIKQQPPMAGIQFPESIIMVEDLDWGNCERLSWSQSISESMIARASVWIDDDHPILADFGMLSASLGERPALDENGNNDILRNHLLKRRWVWITRLHHRKRVIDISRTEEFYDARVAYFNGADCYLQNFCERRRCTQRQMEKLPCHLRGKLEHLMMMSQMAETKMTKKEPTTQGEKDVANAAAKFGPWLDFLVNSTCNGNGQLSRALHELEVARCFISSVRLAALGNDGYEPGRIPEIRDVEHERHWIEDLIRNLSNERKLTWATRQKEAALNRLARRRPKPILTEWQLSGERLYDLQAFCPQTEAECALRLLLYRQELPALEKEASNGKVEEKFLSSATLARVRSCHCSDDNCQYSPNRHYSAKSQEWAHYTSGDGSREGSGSSSREPSPGTKVETYVELPTTGTLPSARLDALLQPEAAGTALSIISEEKSQPTTPMIEQGSSKITIVTTPSGQANVVESSSATNTATNTAAGLSHIYPYLELQASPGLQNGVTEAPKDDDEEELSSNDFLTPPEAPSTPITAPAASQQNSSVESEVTRTIENGILKTFDQGEHVTTQIGAAEVAEVKISTLEDPKSDDDKERHGSQDSGYKSKESSQTD
jgi:hypothetical protein